MKRISIYALLFVLGFVCGRCNPPKNEIPVIHSKDVVIFEDKLLGLRSIAQIEGDTITGLNVYKR